MTAIAPPSTRAAVRFDHLTIERIPGLSGSLHLRDISPGLNLVYGPNASGKSTTAWALQAMLWPDLGRERAPAEISSTLTVGSDEWLIDLRGKHEAYQLGSAPSPRPTWSVESYPTRDRYRLTLHDLLHVDNARFAETIHRESQGGYDLIEAATASGFREKPAQRRKEPQALRESLLEVNDVRKTYSGLTLKEQELPALHKRRERALDAEARLRLFKEAHSYTSVINVLANLKGQLATFVPFMELLTGNEAAELDELRRHAALLRAKEQETAREIETARLEIAATRIASPGLSDDLLPQLRARLQHLQQLTSQVETLRREVASTAEARRIAAERLSGQISEGQLRDIEAAGLNEFVQVTRSSAFALADQSALDTMSDWIGAISLDPNRDATRDALRLLSSWLRQPRPTESTSSNNGPSGLLIVAIVVIVIEAALLASQVHIALAGLAVIGLVLFLLARRPAPQQEESEAERIEREYGKLGVDLPERWEEPTVEALVERLTLRWRAAEVEAEKAQRWDDLAPKRARVAERFTALDLQHLQLAARFGLSPSLDADSLTVIVQQLTQWQSADSRWRASCADVETTQTQIAREIDQINAALAPFMSSPATDLATASGSIEDLARRDERHRAAVARQRASQSNLENLIVPDINRQERAVTNLFAKFNLTADDESPLRQALDSRHDYQTLTKALNQANLERERLEAILAVDPSLICASRDQIERQIAAAEQEAGARDDILRTIAEIEKSINDARGARTLEDALTRQTERKRDLFEARVDDYRSAAGWELTNFIAGRTRDVERPAVFHRARDWFAEMTRGAYRLELDDSGTAPVFRASDTSTGRAYALDELSSATRVQLLMAVRLAFVEELEQGPRLPLILDETLANTDDVRATAIIDATLAIVRQGRQVFYFTAQTDEVLRWQERLSAEPTLPHRVFGLGEIRGLAAAARPSRIEPRTFSRPPVPAPDGSNHEAYREVLRVPPLDPWTPGTGHYHLWYVVAAPADLHELLELGIATWGQLNALIDAGAIDRSSLIVQAASVRAELIAAFLSAWRIGRARPVGRADIIQSGTIGDQNIEEVVTVAASVNGDATRLLSALDAGKVRRLRSDRIENLRTWFADQGLLAEGTPLDSGDTRARVLAASMTHGLPQIHGHEIDALIDSWFHRTGAFPHAEREEGGNV